MQNTLNYEQTLNKLLKPVQSFSLILENLKLVHIHAHVTTRNPDKCLELNLLGTQPKGSAHYYN